MRRKEVTLQKRNAFTQLKRTTEEILQIIRGTLYNTHSKDNKIDSGLTQNSHLQVAWVRKEKRPQSLDNHRIVYFND